MNLDYRAVLADLERRKIELDQGIAAIRRLAARFGRIPPLESGELNITAETLRFLSERRYESFYASEIADAIGCRNVGSVRGAIFRHIRKGELRKDEDGRVRLGDKQTEENRDAEG